MPARVKLTESAAAAIAQPQGTREEWLETAVLMLDDLFVDAGLTLPRVRVSCSFPGGGSPLRRIGECWPRARSVGLLNEIFLSPVLFTPAEVLGVLVHELVHAVDDCASGHGAEFKRMATAVGLVGKMRSAHPGPALAAYLEVLAAFLGPYPHALLKLNPLKKPKKQSLNSKCTCDKCDFHFTVTPKMVEENDILFCPVCAGRLD